MTKDRFTLTVNKRTVLGKKSKLLRAKHIIPANLYGQNIPSLAIEMPELSFLKILSQAGETSVVYVKVEGEEKEYPVLLSEFQRHPVKGNIIHANLHIVNLKEKVDADIPLETIGESPAVKAGGVLVTSYNEIPVSALPTDLPENFTLDISGLENVGDALQVKDLSFNRDLVTVNLEDDEVLVTIQAQKEEEVEPVSAEPLEVETTVQGKVKEEGEVETPAVEKKSE